MKFATLFGCFSLLTSLAFMVQAQVDYSELNTRHFVDELAQRDYYEDELSARDLMMDYEVRSQLISEFTTRELVEELKNRLQKRNSAGKFHKAVSIINSLPKDGHVHFSTADQLFFYKYYKQATVGDNNTPRPGTLDAAGKAKWDAWHSVRGVSKDQAEKQYVSKAITVLQAGGEHRHVAEIQAA